jgi:hypothetical protein
VPLRRSEGERRRGNANAAQGLLARLLGGHEGLGIYARLGLPEDELAADVWLDPGWTSCEELGAEGEAGVILVDRREA